MANRSAEEIINNPINPDEFKSDSPETKDDIVGLEDMDMDDEFNIDDSEVDPMGDDALDDNNFEKELEDDGLDLPEPIEQPEMIPPEEQIKWTPVPQENGDVWSEHVNGYILRARPLSSKEEDKIKYAVQLFEGDRLLEKGVIWIEQNSDPREFLQNVSDRILDRMGLLNVSKMDAEPEEPEIDLDEVGAEEELDLDSEGEEDLDLEDIDLEI